MKEPGIPPFSLVVEIPPPIDYEHLGQLGLCNPGCWFHRNDEQSGYSCTLGLAVVSEFVNKKDPTDDGAGGDWTEMVMRPGTGCPRGTPHPLPPLPQGEREAGKENGT